ncbi:MAG: motility associated factor glycosyltransferase family protein [Spirochaetales bacterium]|nr:motility associated factor glycosyltransferase family protein [Spirochaetales bacterium]
MNYASSDFFISNCRLFSRRFPDQAALLTLDNPDKALKLLALIPPTMNLSPASSGDPTVSVQGQFLHSQRDPRREAEKTLSKSDIFTSDGCLFCGSGLLYLPELYSSAFPQAPLVIIESELPLFLLALSSRPLDALFAHPQLVIALALPAHEAAALPEQLGFPEIPLFTSPALTAVNPSWWREFEVLVRRNREKRAINANTLKKFGPLWLRNMCKNLQELGSLGGVQTLQGLAQDIPVLLLAAGPSLDTIMPSLHAYSRHCLILAVDTACRVCIQAGVTPDIVVLVDPQYWNYKHLEGLDLSSSILITEGAAWPAVFSITTRRRYLCSSLFPLGKFLEKDTIARGELGAGGSVSTTAWDAARLMGAKDIYVAGLDLGYPGKKTHASGSLFEELSHMHSNRLSPAETTLSAALSSTGLVPAQNWKGQTIATDKRLLLYAWWFESRFASFPELTTRILGEEGVLIPGAYSARPDDILALPVKRDDITRRIQALPPEEDRLVAGFPEAVQRLLDSLEDILLLARDAERLSQRTWTGANELHHITKRLDAIDQKIRTHPAKEVAAMVFSAQETEGPASTNTNPLAASQRVYHALVAAAEKNIELIKKFSKEIEVTVR